MRRFCHGKISDAEVNWVVEILATETEWTWRSVGLSPSGQKRAIAWFLHLESH